jgi:hypothetical protein
MDNAFSFKDVQLDMSDIPSYASLDEATLYVLEANTVLFNNLKREIGLNELGIFETTGCTVSYVVEANEGEEGSKSGLVDKAKAAGGTVVNKSVDLAQKVLKFIEVIGAKIKGLFEAAMRKISELTAKAANAFGGRLDEKKLKEALGKTEITFTSGGFDNLKEFIDSGGELHPLVFGSAPEADIKGKISDIIGGDLNKANLVKFFEGESKKQTLDPKGVEDICELIKNFKDNNAAVKKLYKDCEKIINDKKKEVKRAKVVDNDMLNAINANLRDMTLVYGTAMSSYYKLIRQDVNLAIKLTAKASKLGKAAEAGADKVKAAAKTVKEAPGKAIKNAKEKANAKKEQQQAAKDFAANGGSLDESAVPEGRMTYTEEVESLFNWSF